MNRRITFITTTLAVVGVFALIGITGNATFNLAITNAEQNQQTVTNVPENDFQAINQLAQNYKAYPTIQTARELVVKVFDTLSILEIPASEKSQIIEQVAIAHSNGSSNLQETNIVVAINDLALESNAPDFAYTNADQVEVTRKYLNRLAPDLVSANGGMTDIEAFAVFVGLLSQKIDNEDFMVTSAQFSQNMNGVTSVEIPGRPKHNGQVVIIEETPETYQMLQAINNFMDSKKLEANDIISMIGIQ